MPLIRFTGSDEMECSVSSASHAIGSHCRQCVDRAATNAAIACPQSDDRSCECTNK